MASRTLDDIWPFFGLTVATPRVRLSYPTDDGLASLIALADDGVHPIGRTPFASSWSLEDPDSRSKSMAQFHWANRANLSPERWLLAFIVTVDEEVVGSQDITTREFLATRTAATGSWLGAAHQRQGIGTEMRRAILHLIFAGLGAEVAETEAFASNRASQRVTEKLGYQPNGESIAKRGDGRSERCLHYRLSRSAWEDNRSDDITIEGLGPCLPFLGL